MRSLVLVAAACLALAACGDPAPDQNLIEVGNDTVETLPPNDNWVPVNTDEVNQQAAPAKCGEDRKCLPDESGVE